MCFACTSRGSNCLDISHKTIEFDASKDQAIFNVDQVFSIDWPKRDFSRYVATRILNLQKVRSTKSDQRPALLDEVYDVYHNVISNHIMSSEYEALAMINFEIISHATSHLRKTEFEHALGSICSTRGLQSDDNWTVAGAILATGCLIMTQHNLVCFFQTSLFTFLEKFRHRWFPSGHADMARACLTKLMCHNSHTLMNVSQASSSLFAYVARAWGRHVRACSSNHDIEVLALKYLADTDRLQVGIRVAYDMRAPGFDEVSGIGPPHVCSIFGMESLMNQLLVPNPDVRAEVDARTHTYLKTPLMYAVSSDHLNAVVLLLEQGANPYLTNHGGFTAVFEALTNRKHDVLIHFLTCTTIERFTAISEDFRHTALMHIQYFTSIELVPALLVCRGIDINQSDPKGRTVLSHLLVDPTPRQSDWKADVARLILAIPGFNTHAVDEMRRSYIQQLFKSPRFDEDLLEILLAADIDLENRNHAGETAVFYMPSATTQQPMQLRCCLNAVQT